MPWTVSFWPERLVVETVYSGVLSPEDLESAIDESLTAAREHRVARFLADCSGLQGGHSILDLYGMATMLEAKGVPPGVREAVILPQLNAPADDVRFWETVCQNRGYAVRVFSRREDALDWLGDSPPEGQG